MAEEFDCIILGAGIAGVTAARDLARAGRRVLILEAAAKVGGRMRSVRNFVANPNFNAADWPLEAGAEYVHVGNRGRYGQFLAELDWLQLTRRKFLKWGELRGTRWHDGGGRVAFKGWRPPRTHVATVFSDPNIFDTVDLIDEVKDFTGDVNGDDLSVGKYVRQQLFQGRGVAMGRYALASHTPGILYDKDIETGCPISGGSPQDTISVAGLRADNIPAQLKGETAEYRLEDEHNKICGYDTLPSRIAKEFQGKRRTKAGHVNGDIKCEHQVKRVRRSGDVLDVVATDASGRDVAFTAKAVISTLSVGALQKDLRAAVPSDRVFAPFWTPAKSAALDVVQMGPISKLVMEFKEKVWDSNGATTLLSLPEACSRTFFIPFPGKSGVPWVMTALLTGAQHLIVRSLSPTQAANFVLRELERMLTTTSGKWTTETVLQKRPDGSPNFLWENWAENPFSCGGVSFLKHGEASIKEIYNAREALKTPVESLPLFWAGEATATAYNSRYQPLSVHGAYISGVGAAEDVDNYLRWLEVSSSPASAREGFLNDYRLKNKPREVPPPEPREDVRFDFSPEEMEAIRRFGPERPDVPDADGRNAARLIRALLRYPQRPPSGVRPTPFSPHSVWVPLTLEDSQGLLEYAARFQLGNSMEYAARLLLNAWMQRT